MCSTTIIDGHVRRHHLILGSISEAVLALSMFRRLAGHRDAAVCTKVPQWVVKEASTNDLRLVLGCHTAGKWHHK